MTLTTTSYPARGTNGLTASQWAGMFASRDGIIEDYHTGGLPACRLTLNDATNEATVGVGKVSVNGYVLDITAAEVLSVPAVGSITTYYIAAKYDPALNVPGGGGVADTAGPCRLVVNTSLTTAGGEEYVLLYSITRSPSQVLTLAPRTDYRRWIGPVLQMENYPGTTPTGFGSFPRGSMVVQTKDPLFPNSLNVSTRAVNAAGTALEWVSLTRTPALPFPAPGALVANDSSSPAEMFRIFGSMVGLRGTLKRSSGANLNTGAEVILGTLPVGWRPAGVSRFICLASGPNPVGVRVTSDGVVTLYDPPVNIIYVDLGGVVFRAEQ